MSAWAMDRNVCLLVAWGWPINKLTSSMKALSVCFWVGFLNGEGNIHLLAFCEYASDMLSVPITQWLLVSPAPWPIPCHGRSVLCLLYLVDTPYLCLRWYLSSFCVCTWSLIYWGLAPCWRHARLLGASIMQSKQVASSLSTTIMHMRMVSASSKESTLVIARLIAHQPVWPPPWLSVSQWAFLLQIMKPLEENHLSSRL